MTNKAKYCSLYSLLLLVIMFTSCGGNEPKTIEVSEGVDFSLLPSMVGDNVHTLISDSGRVTYQMEAPKLAIFDKVDTPYWDLPEGLHIITYSEDGVPNGDIKSKFAIYHIEKELWELRKQVEAQNEDGSMIETELLYWNQKEHTIYSDTFVKITEDDMITKGYGFESDEKFDDWTLRDFEVDYIDRN